MCTAIFNVSSVTLIKGHLQKNDRRKHSKTWVSNTQDMSQTENSNQVSLPVAGEHGSFLYAINKVIICNFV